MGILKSKAAKAILLVLLGYWVVTAPRAAAATTHNGIDQLKKAGHSATVFLSDLTHK
jgi:hypothetical protein